MTSPALFIGDVTLVFHLIMVNMAQTLANQIGAPLLGQLTAQCKQFWANRRMSQGPVNMPLVTACVPTYNSARFISATLESLEAQNYPNLEVMISDDASSDNTREICRGFTERLEQFSLVQQVHNLGWVSNVNALLASARGKYVFILPHDDLIRPTYVSSLIQVLEANQDAILAFSDTKISFIDVGPIGRSPMIATYKDLDGIKGCLERARRAACYQLDLIDRRYPNVLTLAFRGIFRRSAIGETGGLHRNVAGEIGADWAWLFHLALRGEFVRVPRVLAEKCKRTGSLSKNWRYSVFQRLGEWLGCVVVVRRSDLRMRDKLRIQWILVVNAARTLMKSSKNHIHSLK